MGNPPAFPAGWPEAGYEPHYGMTLRDWFAGQVLPAIVAATSAGQHQPGDGFDDERTIQDRMVSDAYKLADAMLAHRKETDNAN